MKHWFSSPKVNLGRQAEVDFARGFTALVLIFCHVGLYLGNPDDTVMYTAADISGSEFGAPIFMAMMGISMVYSRNQTPKTLLLRGVQLFLLGFALSAVRSLLPWLIFGGIDEWTTLPAFFVVDILQFAGLSFLLFSLLKKLKLPSWGMLLLSLVMVGVDQWLMRVAPTAVTNEWAGYFLNLFTPVTEWSCFPFLTWFFFPCFGLCFGEVLAHTENKNKLYAVLLPVSFAGVLHAYWHFHLLYPNYTDYYFGGNFYYMGIKNVLLNGLFITFSLSFWHFAGKILPAFCKTFLSFLSRNLNLFYLLSWVLIGAMIHIFAITSWKTSGLVTVGLVVAVTALCAVLTKAILCIKKRDR